MENLYPLKFVPQFVPKVWGGKKLFTELKKSCGEMDRCGESWEISGVEGNVSEVANGFLAGNKLDELIEVYMGDLVGDKIFDEYGLEFPLLIKFIDANDDLSVQVHPNDELAWDRHQANGKTEMWYVLQADEGGKLNCGFKESVDKKTYLDKLKSGNLMDILNFEPVSSGDVFFMPAGRVHAIGKGVMVAEIQQTSDVTYRIYDYNRKDVDGNLRELHVEEAMDAIDFPSNSEKSKLDYEVKPNQSVPVVGCDYFKTAVLQFNQIIQKDIYSLDSFMIYICVEGAMEIKGDHFCEKVEKGETILVPAAIIDYKLVPVTEEVKVLEIHA